MFEIRLKNNKTFSCEKETTIFDSAKSAGIILEHSCLTARCRSCVVKVLEGDTFNKLDELVLSDEEKSKGFVLSCNAKPLSNLSLDIEDLGDIVLYDKKIVPAKINLIEKITKDVIKVILRLPPNANFKFISGQYVNLIKGNITRSYSVANNFLNNNQLEFYIKRYENGLMSKYWFEEAKVNDLLRIEGPLGSFFLRDSDSENIIFLATGTGIAPVKSIIEGILEFPENFKEKQIWIFNGARYEEDLFWNPGLLSNLDINYVPVLSRANETWNGATGYVQDVVLKHDIKLETSQVYACGSNEMIESSKKLFIKNSLSENNFFSDAFICTN
ncbi:FAD-binding oxidoreductase [Polaribacter sp.]|uniref:FAD-binding oxidoreductase n=1 Tax=Polaribacter sp. TaxID=1920175 RepID=UPI003EF7C536